MMHIRSVLDFATRRLMVSKSQGRRERISLCVAVGNNFEVMDFDKELALAARIGDHTEIFGGGRAVKVADDGWTQWRFEEDKKEEVVECLPS